MAPCDLGGFLELCQDDGLADHRLSEGAPSSAAAVRDSEGLDWGVLAVPPRGTQRGQHHRGNRSHGPGCGAVNSTVRRPAAALPSAEVAGHALRAGRREGSKSGGGVRHRVGVMEGYYCST